MHTTKHDRDLDLRWIGDNIGVIGSSAVEGYAKHGRGAFFADHTKDGVVPLVVYVPQSSGKLLDDDPDAARMVRDYNPETEFVIVIVKRGDRASSYRVGIPVVRLPQAGASDRT